VTYTNPHRWLPAFVHEDGATALRTLVRRYLYAFGPAVPLHFGRWLGIPPRRAVEVFEAMADELEPVELDGEELWVTAGDTGAPREPHRGIRLLPYFDAFVVAGQPRHRLFPDQAAVRALTPTGQAGNYPVLLVDGIVGGVWHQRLSGRRLAITVEPLTVLSPAHHRQLDDAVARIGVIMDAKPTLHVGKVSVGAHA
jgi:hypothetical protein